MKGISLLEKNSKDASCQRNRKRGGKRGLKQVANINSRGEG